MLQDRLEDWYERIGKKLLYCLVGAVGIYIFFRYIFGLIAPFVVAWILSFVLNPVVSWLHKRFKFSRGLGTLVSMLTVLSAVVGVVTLVVRQLWVQAVGFSESFPMYKQQIEEVVEIVLEKVDVVASAFNMPSAMDAIDSLLSQLLDYVGTLLTSLVSMVTKVPNGFIFVLIVLIATFFMTKDFYTIKGFVKAQLPNWVVDKISIAQTGLKGAVGGYIRTQLILMCFTFCICLVGLAVLGRPYAFFVSIGIAVLDAFPVFGSGAVLIPWGIYYLILGRYPLGFGLLCVYGLVVVMRQVMEPKVLSTQIGVHPLVTLMALYIGLRTMGFIGIIVGPVIVVIFQTLQRVGVIEPFKESVAIDETVKIKRLWKKRR